MHDTAPIKCLLRIGDNLLASCSASGHIKVWRLDTGVCVQSIDTHSWIEAAACLAPCDTMATLSRRELHVWHLPSGACVRTLRSGPLNFFTCMEAVDEERLAVGTCDKTRVCSVQTGECVMKLGDDDTGAVLSLRMLSRERLASASKKNKLICVWSVSTGECVARVSGAVAGLLEIVSTKLLATCALGRHVHIYNWKTGELARTLDCDAEGHSCVNALKLLSGRRLVAACQDKLVRVWDLMSGECQVLLRGHKDRVTCLDIVD